MIETRNARIDATKLGVEDHGILTAMLQLNYGGSCQGFGGWAFDQWDEKQQVRFGTAYGMEWIRRVLEAVGVESWEDLKGKYVRVKSDNSKVYGIGHITEKLWFTPEEDMKEFIHTRRAA